MCGRYTLTLTKEEIHAQIPSVGVFRMPWQPRYNIAPMQTVPAILSAEPTAVQGVTWGLIPAWSKDPSIGQKLINARAETLGSKPSFQDAYRKRRCLILADGFYEWTTAGRRKQPIFIHPRKGGLFTFAGLWEIWKQKTSSEEIRTCSIVTTAANDFIARFHPRMPVIIAADTRDRWLDIQKTTPRDLAKMTIPYPEEELEAFPVSPLVNRTENDSPLCIEPLTKTDFSWQN